MKKTIILLSGILALSSCAKDPLDLSPVSEIGANGFYTNDAELGLATVAIYDGLQQVPLREFALTEMLSDNSRTKSSEGDWAQFESFTVVATNQQVGAYWAANYNVVFRANTVLEHLDVMVNETLKTQYEGEALFARALAHFNLVNGYGDVPILDKVIGPEETDYFSRDNVSDVLDFIIADLENAIVKLPSKGSMTFGRATKGAAEALLAKVYLTNGDYSQAETLCASIISGGEYGLESSYSDVFYSEGNDEVIFAITYLDDDLFESQDFSFEMTNGGVVSGLNYLTDDFIANIDANDTARIAVLQNPLNTDEVGKFLTASLNARMCGNDWIVLRLSDVYLMHVEAKMKDQPATQNLDAISSFNMVRNRVGLPEVAVDGTGEITLDDLLAERRMELAFENHRLNDLVRMGKAQTVLGAFATAEGYNFSATDLLLPIPQNEINISGGALTQNAGY